MKLKLTILNEHLRMAFAPVDDDNAPGGGKQPDFASVDDNVEEGDPIVDEFLEAKPDGEGEDAGDKPAEGDKGVAAAAPAQPPAATPQAPAQPPAGAQPTSAPQPSAPTDGQPAAAQPPAQPAQPPAGQPPAGAPAQPPAAQPAAQPPAAAPAQPPQPSAEEQERVRQEQRTAYLAQLEKELAIPQEDQDALLAEPHTVLPKLAARVQLQAIEVAVGLIQQNMPAMVDAVLRQQKAASAAEEQFFSRWPKLKDAPNGRQEVERLLTNYVKLNPQVPREQAINDVGLLAHASLRIPLDVPGASGEPSAAAPASAPPPPAQPGAAGGQPLSRQPTVWDKLDQELFQDES